MTIIFYRTPDGRISHHQKAPENWSPEELAERVADFNREHRDQGEKSREAITFELVEGSIEAYMFKRMEEVARYDKDEIQDALNALDAARDAIQSLHTVEKKEAAGHDE